MPHYHPTHAALSHNTGACGDLFLFHQDSPRYTRPWHGGVINLCGTAAGLDVVWAFCELPGGTIRFVLLVVKITSEASWIICPISYLLIGTALWVAFTARTDCVKSQTKRAYWWFVTETRKVSKRPHWQHWQHWSRTFRPSRLRWNALAFHSTLLQLDLASHALTQEGDMLRSGSRFSSYFS